MAGTLQLGGRVPPGNGDDSAYVDVRREFIRVLNLNASNDARAYLESACDGGDKALGAQRDCPIHLETIRTYGVQSSHGPTGEVMSMARIESCCKGKQCRLAHIQFHVPAEKQRPDMGWPRKTAECPVQQKCSRCEWVSTSGRGKQFQIVQANNPNFLPYTCSQACSDGCAVILTRYALVAEVCLGFDGREQRDHHSCPACWPPDSNCNTVPAVEEQSKKMLAKAGSCFSAH
jgi:hypothetical protein